MSDADHEVIDSPEALFRHLYDEHGVEEARDLDPETAPVQFWLRRHAELERAQRAARRHEDPPPDPRPRPDPRPAPEPRPEARAQAGRRPRFGDPLVEAMARALAGRGHDEAAVRAAIRSFDDGGGEPAVRAAFIEPMLQAAAERLLGARPTAADRSQRPASATGPPPPNPSAPAAPAPPPEPPAASPAAAAEAARPEAAWAVLWADLADTRRPGGDGRRPAGGDGDDLMAVADAVQQQRRVRLLRR
jgi:hypothetical protein